MAKKALSASKAIIHRMGHEIPKEAWPQIETTILSVVKVHHA